MTRPTDAELAALLRGLEPTDSLMEAKNVGGPYGFYPLLTADRARAMAEQFQPENQS